MSSSYREQILKNLESRGKICPENPMLTFAAGKVWEAAYDIEKYEQMPTSNLDSTAAEYERVAMEYFRSDIAQSFYEALLYLLKAVIWTKRSKKVSEFIAETELMPLIDEYTRIMSNYTIAAGCPLFNPELLHHNINHFLSIKNHYEFDLTYIKEVLLDISKIISGYTIFFPGECRKDVFGVKPLNAFGK